MIERELGNGHRERVALRKLGAGDEFHFYRLEVIGPDAVMLTGCVVTHLVTRGKRKGKPAYDGPAQKVIVTDAEHRAEESRFETETGKCAECYGTGQVWAGWSKDTGHRQRGCRKCSGSGRSGLPVQERA